MQRAFEEYSTQDNLPLRVGLIGLGAIGLGVIELVRETTDGSVTVLGALVRNARHRVDGIDVVTQLGDLLSWGPDVVVEVAGHDALRSYGPSVLRAGCDLLIASVGALADPWFEKELRESAEIGGGRIHVVSGAIGALDAIAAGKIGGLTRVTHTTRKPATSLLGTEEAQTLTGPKEVFRGTAREGAMRFPESVNVAAAVNLAGIGMDATEVVVVAEPNLDRNKHEVQIEGTFGTLQLSVSNIPTDLNPRSARLVSMSVVHALMKRTTTISIG